MTEVQFLLFVLELFIIRCKGKLSKKDLKELRFDIINIARRSSNLEVFKDNLKTNIFFANDSLVTTYKNVFLRYVCRFYDYHDYITCKIDKVKCYEV